LFVSFKPCQKLQTIQRKNFRMLKIINWKGFGIKWSWPNLDTIPIFRLQKQKETTKIDI
jgi:hypothetical protein